MYNYPAMPFFSVAAGSSAINLVSMLGDLDEDCRGSVVEDEITSSKIKY